MDTWSEAGLRVTLFAFGLLVGFIAGWAKRGRNRYRLPDPDIDRCRRRSTEALP